MKVALPHPLHMKNSPHLMRDDVQSYLELATDYMHAGMWDEAMDVLQRPIESELQPAGTYPLRALLPRLCFRQQSDDTSAAESLLSTRQRSMPTEYCFPFRLESRRCAASRTGRQPDAMLGPSIYLGNLLFDLQPESAMQHWEKSRQLDDSLAMVHRNAGWAAYRVKQDVDQAIDCYERGLSCEDIDPRLLLELDICMKLATSAPERRLQRFKPITPSSSQREDMLPARDHGLGVDRQTTRKPSNTWRTTSSMPRRVADDIHDVYVDAHLLQGLHALQQGQPQAASGSFPESIGISGEPLGWTAQERSAERRNRLLHRPRP